MNLRFREVSDCPGATQRATVLGLEGRLLILRLV